MFGFRQEPGERRRDRRRAYSFRRHFARIKQEGRLPQVAGAAVALLIVGGIAFGQCRGDSITGPSAPTASADGSVAPGTALAPVPSFRENTVDRDFLFTGQNPCNGDPVVARGHRHDKYSITVSAAGDVSIDNHINDAFKSVPVDAQGIEVADPELEYVGSDVHNSKFTVNFPDGASRREITNEHLSRRGGGDHWVLHIDQRTEFSADDFDNPKVEVKGHASCPDKTRCTSPGDCPDRAFTIISVAP